MGWPISLKCVAGMVGSRHPKEEKLLRMIEGTEKQCMPCTAESEALAMLMTDRVRCWQGRWNCVLECATSQVFSPTTTTGPSLWPSVFVAAMWATTMCLCQHTPVMVKPIFISR